MKKATLQIADEVREDVRFAARTLVRAPGFIVGVASLGLAVGATAAVYGTVDWLLKRPPSGVVEPGRLVGLGLTEKGREGERGATFGFSYPQYEVLRETQDAFSSVGTYGKLLMVVGGQGWTDQVVFQYVSGTYFPTLGARALLGRTLRPQDDVEGAPPAVVLSYALWQSRFGGDPDVIGSPIRLQAAEGRIVGVMPEGFEDFGLDWNGPTALWLPLSAARATGMAVMLTSPVTFYRVLGRLRSGIDIVEAGARAQRWVDNLPAVRAVIEANAITVQPARELRITRRDEAGTFLNALLGVCALILTAACFNVANFFLGRAARRRREIALRTVMGATRLRLARALAVEATLLGVATAGCALTVGAWVGSVLARMPNLYLDLPVRGAPITTAGALNPRLLMLAVVCSVATAFAVAFVPMLGALREPFVSIAGSGPRWLGGRLRPTPRQALLVLQVSLAVALSVTAVLYAQGFRSALAADPEIEDPSTLLYARIMPVAAPRGSFAPVYADLLDRIVATPWSSAAGLAYNPPYAGGIGTAAHPGDPEGAFDIDAAVAGPGLLATLGIPLVAGRDLADDDSEDVVVINRTLAERLWPGERAVGRSFESNRGPARVVGVVARERCRGLLADARGCAWSPVPDREGGRTVYVRTVGPAEHAALPLREMVSEAAPGLAVVEARSLESFLDDRIRAERVAALASTALALFSLALLVIGCVSLFVSMVRDRLRDIAIRMALGATGSRILGGIITHGTAITAVGVVVGSLAAYAMSHRLANQLYGVSPTQIVTYVGVSAVVLAVAVVSVAYAGFVATRIEPVEHLHVEG